MEQGSNTDVDSALDLFIGDTKPERRAPKKKTPRGKTEQPADASTTNPTERHIQPLTAEPDIAAERRKTTSWIGRIPGYKPTHRGPKSKTTLRIDSALMDEYRERVFIERRPLGEIIESAMRLLKQSKWSQNG